MEREGKGIRHPRPGSAADRQGEDTPAETAGRRQLRESGNRDGKGSGGGAGNNTSPRELEELLRAVRHYWENEKDYTLNYPNALDDIVSAAVKGDEAVVEVEIVLGYLEPTEGAGYKTVTFKLRREDGTWKVTYDGWIGEEV